MPNLPNRLPERGPLRKLYAWLNQLRDYSLSLRPMESHNTLTGHTALGVSREGVGKVKKKATAADDTCVWL